MNVEACRTEIIDLHRFFQEWFNGTLANDEAAFARFADVMEDGFELIGPDGVCNSRDELFARLRAAHGFAPEKRIWTKNERARRLDDRHWLTTYEEWHDDGDGVRARISTAILRDAEGAPNGLVWLRVHETWMPAE